MKALTPREAEVFALCCEGLATKQIARRLGISRRTVDRYRAFIMLKFDVESMFQAVIRHSDLGGTGDDHRGERVGTDD